MIKQECIGIPDMILLLMIFCFKKIKIKAEIVLSPGGAYFQNKSRFKSKTLPEPVKPIFARKTKVPIRFLTLKHADNAWDLNKESKLWNVVRSFRNKSATCGCWVFLLSVFHFLHVSQCLFFSTATAAAALIG